MIDLLSRLPRGKVMATIGLLAAAAWPAFDSVGYRQAAASPLLRDLALTISAQATAPATPTGGPVLVTSNAPHNYPYYVTSPNVYLFPVTAREHLGLAMQIAPHVRYVYLRVRITDRGQTTIDTHSAALLKFLAAYPRRELPGFVGSYAIGPYSEAEITAAWCYDLWQ